MRMYRVYFKRNDKLDYEKIQAQDVPELLRIWEEGYGDVQSIFQILDRGHSEL